MATIIIDARFYGSEHTGLGRYTTNVLTYLPLFLEKHTVKILLRKKYYSTLEFPANCTKILAETEHYSVREQLYMPSVIDSLHGDLLYTFHFNVPLLVRTPFVVTIHDLIKSHFTGRDTTTRVPWLFRLKRLGYDIDIKHAVRGARSIIVPTNTIKNDILALFNADPTCIHPIPEAPDEIFRSPHIADRPVSLPTNYILFVGNAYPHKNLAVLLQALEKLPDRELVIVAKSTPFLDRTLARVSENVKKRITLIESVSDTDLASIYKGADMLVAPSLMEGFGLPGIEALMIGTPVIASNIPVYREVYGDKVKYFDPHSADDLVRVIQSGMARSHTYTYSRTWKNVAQDIAEVLNESCARL